MEPIPIWMILYYIAIAVIGLIAAYVTVFRYVFKDFRNYLSKRYKTIKKGFRP